MAKSERLAQNLAAALKSLNLSGVDLAASLGVDKSVVRRWMLGHTRPTAVNMARLSQAVAARVPGFSVGDWELEPAAFASRIAVGAAMGLTAPGPMFRAFAGFREAIDSEAPVYVGYWMSYMIGAPGTGEVIARATRVSREGYRMPIEMVGDDFDLTGEFFSSDNRVYILIDRPRGASLSLTILTGSPRATPDLLVGISLFLTRRADVSPMAAPVVSEFRRRFSGDPERDDRFWRGLIDEAKSFRTPQGLDLLSPRIRRALDFRVLRPGEEGEGLPALVMPPALAGA